MFLILTVMMVVLFSVGSGAAQDDKKMMKDSMDMTEMKKSPHHILMMAHHHSALAFATVLRDITKEGKFPDVEIARNAFAEIKHCMDQMESIHKSQMGKMSPEMSATMKPMIAEMKPKMDVEKAAINDHIAALQQAFQTDAPDAANVQKHAAALVTVLEKMMSPAKKMDMSGKKPM